MNKSDDAKTEKKAAKALVKREKKRASQTSVEQADEPTPPTPAERSAAAAERQVRLQSYRVWFAAIGVIIAIATLLVTFKPWELL